MEQSGLSTWPLCSFHDNIGLYVQFFKNTITNTPLTTILGRVWKNLQLTPMLHDIY